MNSSSGVTEFLGLATSPSGRARSPLFPAGQEAVRTRVGAGTCSRYQTTGTIQENLH